MTKLTACFLLASCALADRSPDWFREPEKACHLLEAEGFIAEPVMAKAFGIECSAAPRHSQIRFMISGDSIHRVRRMKLMLTLHGELDHSEVVENYQRLCLVLLKRLGLTVPEQLTDSMKNTRYFLKAQKGGTITFDPGRKPHHFRVLTVRDPALRVVPIPRGSGRQVR